MITAKVSDRGARRVRSGHLWIYASDVVDRGLAQPGDVVHVADPRGRTLGAAHYSSSSQICLRMLHRRPCEVDREFIRKRLQAAVEYRRRVVAGTTAYRLVYGEGDLLPALIVDRYGEYLVVQTLDQGMDRLRDDIVACLVEMLLPAGIVARNDVPARRKENLPLEVSVLHGTILPRVAIQMNGLRFEADLLRGQKTGVFLDQRENYVAAARHARGRALDCFTCTGGFAMHMASRCDSVEGVDSSPDALAAAEVNRRANDLENVRFREANVFDLLTGYAASGQRFSTVVLDPPAFAKSRQSLDAALRGYKEINLKALRLLEDGGVLITCSCSHHVSEAEFLEVVASAALDADRRLRVLERRTQAADHPILLTLPETHYLKCLICEVVAE